MPEFDIIIHTSEQAQMLSKIAERYPFEIWIHGKSGQADAKSLLGLMLLTIENDVKAAERLVEWYRDSGRIGKDEGAEAVLKKNPICTGCWNTVKDNCYFKCGCGSRDFRVCCAEMQINHCGECSDFPCEHYREWVSWGEHHKKAMERLISLRGNT